MATEHEIGVDLQFNGNKLLNKGEESISSLVIFTPTILAVNTNDYNPTGLQTASILRISSSAVISITGIVAPDTSINKKLIIFNIGTNNITLTDASASSAAANRFAMNGNQLFNPNEGGEFIYDQLSSRWRCIGRAI